ncbi:single-stranded DNA-binding protein [Chamaesiphon sp.]|jgi:single-strand DNA-binding protein|uniref:single-stranded DNA-binding protein n=1 Tax=Chamaesiphon sp. TaxID=2814140 RepID=UPI003593882D
MSLNVVHLVGRVGGDPELKWFEGSGKCVCTMTLAVNRRSKNQDQPDWFNLKIWGKTGEIAKNYAKKGSQIGVKGSLEVETWIDKATGTERSRPVIKVDSLDLLGSKKDAAEAMPDYM